MNKRIVVLLGLVLLAGIAWWLMSRKPWSTFGGEMKDFAVKDTAQVTKLFFADMHGGKALLQRTGSGWTVNDKFKADPDKVNMLLATLHDVEVRNPVTDKEHNTVVGILATSAVKVEVYAGEKNIKTIYVGSSTPDQTGTYMLIENAPKAFATHIPGFVGYLTPRFFTEEKKWKTKEIFNVNVDEIKSVSVTYPGNAKQSFTVTGGNAPTLMAEGKAITADQKFLKFYLAGFHGLFFEGYSEAKVAQVDSVKHLPSFCIIEVEQSNGTRTKLRAIRQGIDRRSKQRYDANNEPLSYDPDKYFAFINDGNDMVVIQQYAFGKVFKTLDEMRALK